MLRKVALFVLSVMLIFWILAVVTYEPQTTESKDCYMVPVYTTRITFDANGNETIENQGLTGFRNVCR